MFVMFSPFSFLFLIFYLNFFMMFFMLDSFFIIWVLMEFNTLLFLGIYFSLASFGLSGLMSYFLIQSMSSLNIFLFYVVGSNFFLSVFIFMKMGLFPFFFWYINVVYSFPNFIFWLSGSLQKMPILVMMSLFFDLSLSSFFWFSFMFTMSLAGFAALNSLDFRLLLLFSSVINNSWMVMSQMASFALMCIFFVMYSLNFFFVIVYLNSLSKLITSNVFCYNNSKSLEWFFMVLIAFSGFPPFPIFFIKLAIIYFMFFQGVSLFLLTFVLILNVALLVSYFQYIVVLMVNKYSNGFFYYVT